MIEVRVSVEIGDTDGSTLVRAARVESVLPSILTDHGLAAEQAVAAAGRMIAQAQKSLDEQGPYYVYVITEAQRLQSEEA